MNASIRNSISRGLAPLAVLTALLVATPFSFAGPGSQYWRNSTDSKNEPLAPAKTPMMACAGCPEMKAVALTTTQPQWSNGRGPLVTLVTGMQQVCHSCGAPAITMKPTWPNARGPLEAVALKTTHVCQTTLIAAR